MQSARFRAIIFDIGRVLVRVDVSRATTGLARGALLTPQEIWSALQNDPGWLDWQEGRIPPREWHLRVAKRFGGNLNFEQFTEVWNRALDPKPIQDDSFLQKLSRRYRLAVLSNTDPIHVSYMEKTYDFLSSFPVRIYSCRIGASKPNPLIYREALRLCKVRAEEAVYIDDVPSYAEAAARLGMTSVIFQSPRQLQSELRILGLAFD